MANGRSGSLGDRTKDVGFRYFGVMVVIAVLFGAALMLQLNHLLIDAAGQVLHSTVVELQKVFARF